MKRWRPPRRGAWRFDRSDKRPPMVRLLQDRIGDQVCVAYDQQWRTFWKAQALGYVENTESHPEKITKKGLDFLARWEARNNANTTR